MLSEMSQRRTNTALFHLSVESIKYEQTITNRHRPMDIEYNLMVAKGSGWREGKLYTNTCYFT